MAVQELTILNQHHDEQHPPANTSPSLLSSLPLSLPLIFHGSPKVACCCSGYCDCDSLWPDDNRVEEPGSFHSFSVYSTVPTHLLGILVDSEANQKQAEWHANHGTKKKGPANLKHSRTNGELSTIP
jgi:hypothetical protein